MFEEFDRAFSHRYIIEQSRIYVCVQVEDVRNFFILHEKIAKRRSESEGFLKGAAFTLAVFSLLAWLL